MLATYLLLFQRLLNKNDTADRGGKHGGKAAAVAKAEAVKRAVASRAGGGGRVGVRDVGGGDLSSADERLKSGDMWGADSVPYWRRKAFATQ